MVTPLSQNMKKIDTYKDTILIDDQERDVNILRIGRLVLAYQTSDLSETGIYKKTPNLGNHYQVDTKFNP